MAGGTLFHARDAATGKARSPRVDRCTDGTTSVMVVEERRWRRPSTSAVRRQSTTIPFGIFSVCIHILIIIVDFRPRAACCLREQTVIKVDPAYFRPTMQLRPRPFRAAKGGAYNYDSRPISIRLRIDRRSTPIQLRFDSATIILRYGLTVMGCCT